MPIDPASTAAFITQDIAEHVFGQHHIEARRIQHQLHGAVVHQQMVERDIRIFARDFDHDLAPELRNSR